jgi:hypothetical protein
MRTAWSDVEEKLFCSPECVLKFMEAESIDRDAIRKHWMEHREKISASQKGLT